MGALVHGSGVVSALLEGFPVSPGFYSGTGRNAVHFVHSIAGGIKILREFSDCVLLYHLLRGVTQRFMSKAHEAA